eukprot:11930245-Alexandrium_andersonii.AAC.1
MAAARPPRSLGQSSHGPRAVLVARPSPGPFNTHLKTPFRYPDCRTKEGAHMEPPPYGLQSPLYGLQAPPYGLQGPSKALQAVWKACKPYMGAWKPYSSMPSSARQ